MATLVHRLKNAVANPRMAADYALYRMGFSTVKTAFRGKLRGSTYSEFRTIRNLALSANELRVIDLIPETGHIFDVGAHVGIWTVPLALARPNATIHSFEGAHSTYLQLENNVAANRLSNVRLHHAAVYDTIGTVSFQIPENASVFGRIATPIDTNGRYAHSSVSTSPCLTLAEYCARHNIQRIAFLKIDVEGAELNVLRGLGPLLAEQRVDYIWTELTEEADNLDSVQKLISDCRYAFYRRGGFDQIVDIREACDGNMLAKPLP